MYNETNKKLSAAKTIDYFIIASLVFLLFFVIYTAIHSKDAAPANSNPIQKNNTTTPSITKSYGY